MTKEHPNAHERGPEARMCEWYDPRESLKRDDAWWRFEIEWSRWREIWGWLDMNEHEKINVDQEW